MSIAKRAVEESQAVARLAVDAAKAELIEHLTPQIQRLIDGRLRAGTLGEDLDRIRRHEDGYGDDYEEGLDMSKKDKGKEKVESVAALFPSVNEVADVTENDEVAEAAYDDDGHADMKGESADGGNEGDGMDETIEISEAELEAMYAEALQLEVDVSKGFKDMTKPHELGAGAKYDNTKEPGSLQPMKSGEHDWQDELPPAKKDMIPEGTDPRIVRLFQAGLAENKALARQNRKLREMVESLHGKLTEMNLLNSKILHVNKFMTNHRLNNEQKKSVIESIDKGSTVKEVKSIYAILESTFKAAGAVNESSRRAPRADSQRARTSGAPNAQVLRESADKAETAPSVSRWQQLAGIVNGKS